MEYYSPLEGESIFKTERVLKIGGGWQSNRYRIITPHDSNFVKQSSHLLPLEGGSNS